MFKPSKVSEFWKNQTEARAIVEEHGCRICGWKLPGEIFDVSGDLWCHHCVEEYMGLRPGIPMKVADLEPALIP